MTATQSVAAYEPATGRQAWRIEVPEGTTNAGVLATAGNVLFQGLGSGLFLAFDARSGQRLFTYKAKTVTSSPLTYAAGGRQYVSVTAGDTILAFGLP